MSCPFGPEELKKLQAFVGFCTMKPEILNMPELSFVKTFIEKLGGKVPSEEFKPQAKPQPEPKPDAQNVPESEEIESDKESDIELDMEGVIEPDNDEPQNMGDESKVPTEEEVDQASEYRSKAAAAFSEQKFEESIDLYSKAIELNPGNALFHAKRGQAFLKLKKPKACIRDCDKALELNCDSAAAYKFRGRAHRLLGSWELAAKDLRQACKLDFDEEADEWLREVTPNAKRIEAHRIKTERKKIEREQKKTQERINKAREANKKAQEEQDAKAKANGGTGAGAGAGGGASFGFPGSVDPEVMKAFSDPEVMTAMTDIMSNPANISKYQSNPKIMNIIMKVASATGAGGFPGAGAFGGAGGFPGAGFNCPGADAGENRKAPPKPDFADDGLD